MPALNPNQSSCKKEGESQKWSSEPSHWNDKRERPVRSPCPGQPARPCLSRVPAHTYLVHCSLTRLTILGAEAHTPTPQTSITAESQPSVAPAYNTGGWVHLRWVSQTRASRNCLWGPRDKIDIDPDILISWLQTVFITMVSCGFQNKLWRAREPYLLDRWEHEGVESSKISSNLGTEKLCGGQHLTEALRISCG